VNRKPPLVTIYRPLKRAKRVRRLDAVCGTAYAAQESVAN
jgi:hypothetical protein